MKKLNNQRVSPGALLIAVMIASGSVLCHGAITGGLTGPFSGWTGVGDVAMTDQYFAINDNVGANTVAIASTYSPSIAPGSALLPASTATLGTALQIPAPTGTAASGFYTTLTGPGTVSFDWNFFTGESSGNDSSFYTLHPLNSTGTAVTLGSTPTSVTGPNINYATGNPLGLNKWNSPTYTSSGTLSFGAGQWLLGFGVVDNGLSGNNSVIGIQNVSVVPEPWAWSLISALAMGGLAFARRMRVNRA